MIRRLALLAGLAVLLAGCGVPADDAPRTVPVPPGPFPAPVTAAPTTAAGGFSAVLCFVRDDRLAPTVRRVAAPASPDDQLRQLFAGPTTAERDTGLTSALPGAVAPGAVQLTGTRALVEVSEAGDGTGRSDEVLAFGQIVCTLTARADVASVSFVRGGRPLGVPRADGSLSQDPLTARDYAALTVGR